MTNERNPADAVREALTNKQFDELVRLICLLISSAKTEHGDHIEEPDMRYVGNMVELYRADFVKEPQP